MAWRFSPAGIAARLFVTCWLVYSLHFSSNIVREIYPALAIGDHLSLRVDEYAGLHPDIFEKEGYGWHIGNNVGVSLLAAVPYVLARPIIDRVVGRVQATRLSSGQTISPSYDSPFWMAQEFYQEAWRRGLDVKFGLAALVMQALCMAPSSALGAVAMFYVLRHLLGSNRAATWLALLYAFGTPVFFRTGYLNHNLMLGHIGFAGFIALWDPSGDKRWSIGTRALLAGLAGGTAVLFDYSGLVLLIGLFAYLVVQYGRTLPRGELVGHSFRYGLGALGPILVLWFTQWVSFGHPFYPGQHWMPPVEWIEQGYQGYGLPQLELLVALAFDYRYGLFLTSPLLLLAFLAPLLDRGERRLLPARELVFLLLIFAGFWLFFSGSNYTRLQFNTGMRYLAPVLPFLFLAAVVVLTRLPLAAIYFIGLFSVVQAWCMAMYRDVERGLGLLDPILHVFLGGFQLPFLTTLSRMGRTYGDYFYQGASPLPLFVLTAAILYGLWSRRLWSRAGSDLRG